MYHVNDITADINSILSGKLDQLNPHLFNTLLADFVGTSEISRAFVTQLSNGYLNKLTTLPRHPAIVQGLADSRTAQLAAIDHEIVSEKARLLKTRKKFDTEISKLERHGPRRHLQRVRNERDSLIEIAQKRIDKLQSNPEQIADSRTLRNYGVLVAERVISGLNELPLTTRTAFFNHLKTDTKKPEFAELNELYDFESGLTGVALIANALRTHPQSKPAYDALLLSRKCSDILEAAAVKGFPNRIFRSTLDKSIPDLTTALANEVLDFLPHTVALKSTDIGFELCGRNASHLIDSTSLYADCPVLAELLDSLTAPSQVYTSEYAAMYLRGTIHHWLNGGRSLPGHRNAYIDAISSLETLKDGGYRVTALVHTVEKQKDGSSIALPPLEAHIIASKDWLNAAYPGSLARLSIGESLDLTDTNLMDYVFSASSPPQDLNDVEIDGLNFF